MAANATIRPRRSRLGQILYEMRREWTAYLFLSPGLALFLIFTVFSVGYSFYLSFHEWNILEPGKPYVGLENYHGVLTDRRFHEAVINTLYYTIGTVPTTMFIGLLIALLLNNQIRARALFRTMYYLPVITPLVVAAIIWKWVYHGDFGLLNYYLIRLGLIDNPILWLSNPRLAMPAVIIMSIWGGVGFNMVVYLAGLQAIPEDYYDAAKVDGAGMLARFRHITVPLPMPTSFFLLIISIIGSLQVFTQVYIMTSGGPLGRTRTIGFYLYEKAFKHFEMGYASAMAYVLFAMIFIFTMLQVRTMRRDVEY